MGDSNRFRRFSILGACMLMLLFLGTNQAWSVFVAPLRGRFGFSAFQMQLVFSTGTVSFCTVIVVAGRLHDRLGPRPLAIASAVMIGLAWTLAWAFGESYIWLWLAVGVLASSGSAVGYVCPLATAMKWFPSRPGLVSGLAAAGFAAGPVLLSGIAEALMRAGWRPGQVFGLVAITYAPVVLLTGLALAHPPGELRHGAVREFRRRALVGDRRFWSLWIGMFAGTFPFLLVMGNAKPLAVDRGFSAAAAATAISVLAIGNACGRIFWGLVLDRTGPRRAMLTRTSRDDRGNGGPAFGAGRGRAGAVLRGPVRHRVLLREQLRDLPGHRLAPLRRACAGIGLPVHHRFAGVLVVRGFGQRPAPGRDRQQHARTPPGPARGNAGKRRLHRAHPVALRARGASGQSPVAGGRWPVAGSR